MTSAIDMSTECQNHYESADACNHILIGIFKIVKNTEANLPSSTLCNPTESRWRIDIECQKKLNHSNNILLCNECQ